ncbi:hypothetical protein [Pimelobacter simplex]|uniref:hypothetical protein n=1 Tax=Nocardioides simplex TaxID=2045 RepID=UPI00214FC232|nr:hypothetical protein [Pimelobacter simplex]UUW88396.1 hypothetical protein M0M43_21990 [Pimelobacter simplex]UUW97900.1 hypothetical protein M0M48_10635 [Pimelobacter simplex]
MGRKLSTTALIEGVVYEAGTDESDIAGADKVSADVWAGEGDPAGAAESEQGDVVPVAEVAALRGQYDAQLADRDTRIADLEEQIENLTAEIEQLKETSPPADPTADPAAPVDYSSLDLDALKAEIDRRNEGRADADRIGKRGSQETLAAALTADDAAKG